ncbi:MAG: phosphoadenosine phosphosulfate reductase family protein [Gammaproteobacteria bacterium]|nr:phosphoadenosine phosphosulfate reductase family protein [Gammaproteobacteria bacterium]
MPTRTKPPLLELLEPIADILPDQASTEASEKFLRLCLSHSKNPIITTSFGPQSGVLLHMVSQITPNIKVVWVDSGYNLPATYQHAEKLTRELGLNLKVYTPSTSAAFWDATRGGIPTVDDERHAAFTNNFKITPFQQALEALQPDVWISSVRREQSAHRATLPAIHEGPSGTIKLAPLIAWQENDMQAYLDDHQIADESRYFDPVKAQYGRECGLHKL